MDARIAPESLPPLAYHGFADVGASGYSAHRFSGHHLFRLAEKTQETRFDRRNRPGTQTHFRQTRHPARRADGVVGRRCGCRSRFGVGEDHFPRNVGGKGNNLLPDFGGYPRLPRFGAPLPRFGSFLCRQLLCGTECRRLLRRVVLLHSEGREMPDGTFRPISASMRRELDSSNAR